MKAGRPLLNSEYTPESEGGAGGAAWVNRFLQPLLSRHFFGQALECLQLAPDDSTEAARLEELGHRCRMTEPGPGFTLPAPDASCDLIFTGRFTQRALGEADRVALARECWRVLRGGGVLLVLVGNRWCPLDLSRNGPLLHGPRSPTGLAFRECAELFVRHAGFHEARPVSLHRHFAWTRLPSGLRLLGKLLDFYWRSVAVPSREWLYSSPLNPIFLLWLNKHPTKEVRIPDRLRP